MPFTLNNQDIESGRLSIPEYGVWIARVRVSSEKTLASGALATLVVGDQTLLGRIRSGATYVGASSYMIVGGADGWGKPIPARTSHRNDAGVRLFEVIQELSLASGEPCDILSDPKRTLGYAWIRPRGTASAVLRDLGERFWVAPDGRTKVGQRPSLGVSKALFSVDAFDPATKSATLRLGKEELSKILPGYTLSADSIRLRVRSVEAFMSGSETIYQVTGS